MSKRSVIVYGPKGSGKTRNAERIRKAFGLDNLVDEWDGLGKLPRSDFLVLTGLTLEAIRERVSDSANVLAIEDAMSQTEMIETENLDTVKLPPPVILSDFPGPTCAAPTAPEILQRAAQHMLDRAATRDSPQGERSMARTVAAFNALTGHALNERDGWVFMVALKTARACSTPTGIPDDYEDGAAYFGLAGEAATRVAPAE